MALKLKNGAVFLHIPKTGGNWVTKMLTELDLIESSIGDKHADIEHLYSPPAMRRNLIKYTAQRMVTSPATMTKPFMFCFVRDPLSWYESWFKYMEQPSRQWLDWGDEINPYNWHPNAMLNGLGKCSFPEFVRNVNSKRPGYVTEMYGWYTKPRVVDFVGKQEQLVDDFVAVLKLMEIDFDEDFVRGHDRVGVSPKPSEEVRWPDDLKKETAIYEYVGMIRYGYQSTLDELGVSMASMTSGG